MILCHFSCRVRQSCFNGTSAVSSLLASLILTRKYKYLTAAGPGASSAFTSVVTKYSTSPNSFFSLVCYEDEC